MIALQHPLIRVIRGEQIAYGGSQLWADNPTIREVGCGIIAAEDVLLHLAHHHPELPHGISMDASLESAVEYNRFGELLRKKYFPLIPHFGINGVSLCAGLNRYFREHAIPLRSAWGVSHARLYDEIARMLKSEIPVILSVGKRFPAFWHKDSLSAYTKDREGVLHKSCGIRAHYVIVTAMDDAYLTVSSWGRIYYLSRKEFSDFARRQSAPLFCNIARIYPCNRKKSSL